MKNKRGKGLLAVAAVCAAFGLFASCGGNGEGGGNGGEGDKTITLVNFDDSSVTAKVGDAYELKNPAVKDSDGKEYTPEVVVKDAAGNVIPTIGGNVEIRNVNGYVIEYTIKIGNQTYMKKITLTVTDDEKPVINIASPEVAYVNTEYALPAVTVRDNAENPVSVEKKLYFVNGEIKTEVTAENGKFTPTQKGTYEYYVKATDAAGNVAEKSVPFSAVTKLGHFVLADFSDNADNATTNKRFDAETVNAEVGWEESFEGASGVAWTKGGAQAWKNFSYRFGSTAAEMAAYAEEGWDYYSIRLYIDQEGLFRVLSWNVDYVNANGADTNASPIAGKQWVTVYMSKATIEDATKQTYWQNADEPYGNGETGLNAFNTAPLRENGSILFWINNLLDDTKVYVDEIKLEKGANLSVSGIAERVVVGETVSFTVNNPNQVDYDTQVTLNGNAVELANGTSFVAAEAGVYKIKVTNKSAGFVGACEYTVEVLPKFTLSAADIQNTTLNTEITLPKATVKNEKTNAEIENAAIDLYLQIDNADPAAISAYVIIPAKVGKYTIIYRYTADGEVYELQKSFVVTDPDRYFTSFENEEFFSGVTADEDCSITRSNEHKASGAYSAKVALAANKQARIGFTEPVKQRVLRICFKVYGTSDTNFQFCISTGAYNLNGADVAAKTDEIHDVTLTANQWVYKTIDIPANAATKISAQDILNGGITSFGFYAENAVTFYLDDIEFITSDISFEWDDQHSAAWDAAHPWATKNSEFVHSGEYSAKFAYKNADGMIAIYHAPPAATAAYPVPAGAKKIGFWLYNDGAAVPLSFSCASASYSSLDVCNISFTAESGWKYYEFDMATSPESVVMFALWSGNVLNQSFYMDDIDFIVAEVSADITFEDDADHSSEWKDAFPLNAIKSNEQAHDGTYSAKFAFTGAAGELGTILHAAPARDPWILPQGCKKVGVWLYTDKESDSLLFSAASSSFGAYDVFSNVTVNLKQGWNYVEADVADGITQIVQFSLYTIGGTSAVYMDSISFIK